MRRKPKRSVSNVAVEPSEGEVHSARAPSDKPSVVDVARKSIDGKPPSTVLPPAAPSHAIFHTVGLFTLAAYALALWPLSIWYGRGWGITIKSTVDGLIYAVVTGLIFMWLWPR